MNLNKLIYDWSSEQYADRNNLVFEGKNKAYGASSQGLSVVAESPFTFQPGLHLCYYATILTSAFQRAMQITKFIVMVLIVSFGSQCSGGIGRVAGNGFGLGEGGDFHYKC